MEKDKIIIYLFGAMLIFSVAFNSFDNLFPPVMVDEVVYGNVVSSWKSDGVAGLVQENDNKPVPFLALQRFLKADEDVLYTRLFNIFLIVINTILLYHLTKKPEAALFAIIPIFLNSMWLTAEMVELFFILLSFCSVKFRGLMIGIACLFRPYAVIYVALLDRKQAAISLFIGGIYAFALWYFGLFQYYFVKVATYPFENPGTVDIYAFVVLLFLVGISISENSSEVFRWSAVSMIPLLIRPFAHYYILPYSLLFLECLKKAEADNIINF